MKHVASFFWRPIRPNNDIRAKLVVCLLALIRASKTLLFHVDLVCVKRRCLKGDNCWVNLTLVVNDVSDLHID